VKKNLKKIFTLTLAIIMLFSALPVSVFAKEQPQAAVSEQQSHVHKKVTETKKATFSSAGQKIIKCSDCGKVLSKKAIPKIKTVKLKKLKFDYTGKRIRPTVTVKDSKGKTLKKGRDYIVVYFSNVNPGKAKATVIFKGDYSGTKKLSFLIIPVFNADITSQMGSDGKVTLKMDLSWQKVTGAASYKVSLYNGKKLFKSFTTNKTTLTFKNISYNTTYKLVFTAYDRSKNVIIKDSGIIKLEKFEK